MGSLSLRVMPRGEGLPGPAWQGSPSLLELWIGGLVVREWVYLQVPPLLTLGADSEEVM